MFPEVPRKLPKPGRGGHVGSRRWAKLRGSERSAGTGEGGKAASEPGRGGAAGLGGVCLGLRWLRSPASPGSGIVDRRGLLPAPHPRARVIAVAGQPRLRPGTPTTPHVRPVLVLPGRLLSPVSPMLVAWPPPAP